MKIDKRHIVTDPKKHGGKRKKPITKFIPHHNAGVTTGESLARYIKNTSRQISATYIIGQNGEVFQGLDESLEPYTTGNRAIDTEAITFEIANSTGAPQWKISDKAFDTLVNLTIDICKRHGIKELNFTGDKRGNIHLHKWYQNTTCPGPYVESLMPEYARRVNAGLKSELKVEELKEKIEKVPVTTYKEVVKVPYIELTKDTSLWSFNANSWSDIKEVKKFKKGDKLDVADIVTNKLGGRYYRTPYSKESKVYNGFNVVDAVLKWKIK